MSKKWTDSLPSLLEGYEEAAPERLWDAVQAGMAPKKRTGAGWWYVAGGLLAAAAVVLAVFLWKPRAEAPVSVVPGDPVVQADERTLPAPDPVSPILVSESVKPAPEAAPHKLPPVRRPIPAAPEPAAPRQTQKEPESQPPRNQGAPADAESAQNAAVAHPEVAQPEAAQPAGPSAEQPKMEDQPFEEVPLTRKKKAGRVAVQFSTGAYLAQARSSSSGFGIPVNPGISPSFTKGWGDVNVYMLSQNRASVTESAHRQNIRLSLGVSYEFAPRWSIGTGLTYTSLRSDYNTDSGESSAHTVRHLYYLGVPITLQWQAFQWKALSINLNAGPLFEWAVGSRVNTQTYIGDQLSSQVVQTQAVKDPRWSLFAGVGVQYQLFRHGAIFLQPGISWHIPANNGVESYYSVHPLSPEFTFGYLFTF